MTSADIVHEFQAYSHLGEKGGGGTLIFSNIRRPGPFLGLTFWCFVMTPKDIHKIFIPQKLYIFLKTTEALEGHFYLLLITYYLLLITYHL